MCQWVTGKKGEKNDLGIMHSFSQAICCYITCMTCMENKYKVNDPECIRSRLLRRQIRDRSQIINSFLDALFSAVAEFLYPGLHWHKAHTCLDASGTTWITWDHVFLSRVKMQRVDPRLVLCLAALLGDQYAASICSRDAQIKMTPPLVCM